MVVVVSAVTIPAAPVVAVIVVVVVTVLLPQFISFIRLFVCFVRLSVHPSARPSARSSLVKSSRGTGRADLNRVLFFFFLYLSASSSFPGSGSAARLPPPPPRRCLLRCPHLLSLSPCLLVYLSPGLSLCPVCLSITLVSSLSVRPRGFLFPWYSCRCSCCSSLVLPPSLPPENLHSAQRDAPIRD